MSFEAPSGDPADGNLLLFVNRQRTQNKALW